MPLARNNDEPFGASTSLLGRDVRPPRLTIASLTDSPVAAV
jgi:hypothetical protein